MSSIANSPFDLDELLIHICTFVDCEDLKALSASSRRMHTITYPILKRHQIYWDKFQYLSDGQNQAPWYWHKFAVSLLTTSLGAPYIRHIKTGSIDRQEQNSFRDYSNNRSFLKDWDISSESDIIVQSESPGQLRRSNRQAGKDLKRVASSWVASSSVAMQNYDLKVLIDHLKSKTWFSDQEKTELESGLRSGQQASIKAILLPLLPNLRTLKIEWSSSSLQQHLGAAARYAAIAHSLSRPCSFFGKVVDIDFTTDRQSSESFLGAAGGEYSLDFLSYFMALPKLRKISARLVTTESFKRLNSLPPSTVTDISFYDQDISPSAFKNLLADGTPVTSVKLSVQTNSRWFDEGKLVDVLLARSQTSLIQLQICRTSNIMLNGPVSSIKLQAFTRLKYITVNYELFQLQGNIRMAELLPSSLEKLELRTITVQQEMPENIIHMLENINLFPSWSELCTHGWISEIDQSRLSASCQQHEIKLSMMSHKSIQLELARVVDRGFSGHVH